MFLRYFPGIPSAMPGQHPTRGAPRRLPGDIQEAHRGLPAHRNRAPKTSVTCAYTSRPTSSWRNKKNIIWKVTEVFGAQFRCNVLSLSLYIYIYSLGLPYVLLRFHLLFLEYSIGVPHLFLKCSSGIL